MMQLLSTKIWDDGPIGCFLEVDLAYLAEMHDLNNVYPLANEKMKVTREG